LLVPLARGGAERFRTPPPSRHTMPNVEIIRCCLDIGIGMVESPRGTISASG